jgi:hypothetical protein
MTNNIAHHENQPDPPAAFELAALNYHTALRLYGEGRLDFSALVSACCDLALASKARRRYRVPSRRVAA